MGNIRILVTESQLTAINNYLTENKVFKKNVKLILNDLVNNYEPALEPVSNGVEYFNDLKINKKINNEMIEPEDLYKYIKFKYPGFSAEFIKLIINDWYFDKIDDDLNLSKNVSMT